MKQGKCEILFYFSNDHNIQLAAISLCNSLFMKTHQESAKVNLTIIIFRSYVALNIFAKLER